MNQVNRDIVLDKEVIWKIKKGIDFNSDAETFLEYLKKEKEMFDTFRPMSTLAPVIGILVCLTLLFLYTSMIKFV
ncbi:hypothetical protein CEE45_10020 [Candidatus Heimdallarchaeota archaeon B3_Heim]|nr:MAG: hypothetical protein CEE45_10020 [Candidatus Heimdallarchaeota archaeon B3_Heim]